jgi:antitoxin FitA
MPTLTISQEVAERLAQRAASHGRTAEAEARDIIAKELDRSASATGNPDNLFDAVRAIVAPVGGVELNIPPRHPGERPVPTFD